MKYLILAAVFALLGGLVDRFAPWVGAHPRIVAAERERAAWKRTAGENAATANANRDAVKAAEKLRKDEGDQAKAAVGEISKACDLRVARARTSAARIQTLVSKEPRHDPNGCPVRDLMPDGELRDALIPR